MTAEEYIKSKRREDYPGGHLCYTVSEKDALKAIEMARNEAINSGWHDATEKPKLGELIIVEVYGKIWDYGKYDVCDTIHPKARWAYVKDLLPIQ